jgi:Ca2+-binding RTX toxin-like protein
MGMVEVAYEIRARGDVMVASENTEKGDGWEYQNFLDDLVANPGMDGETLAGHIIDAFAAHYGDDQTLSAVDLGQIGSNADLAGKLDAFATLMLDSATSDDWKAVLAAHDDTRDFPDAGSSYQSYDLGQWMDKVLADTTVSAPVASAAQAVKTALETAVLDRYPDSGAMADTAQGLSVYAPFAELNPKYDPSLPEGAQLDFVADTRWEEFVGPLGIDVVTVIDRSGSMSGTKIDQAKTAAKQFVDLMIPKDKIGVVSYSSSASTDFPLDEILTDGSVEAAAKAAIDAISAGGSTSIGSGVQAADNELDRFPGDRTRAMLVMSDGMQNTDPEPIGVINGQVDPDILIYTVGLGQDADAALLAQMAGMRNGTYFYAPSGNDLQQIYFRLAGRLGNRQQVSRSSRIIQQDEQINYSIWVDGAASRAQFTVDWQGSDMDLSLRAPDGTLIDRTTAQTDPYVSMVGGDTYEMYTVALPQGGEWQMIVDGVSVPPGGEKINMYASVDSTIQMAISTDRNTYEAGDTVHVEAKLYDEFPIPGATVTATVEPSTGTPTASEQLTLYDDGVHGDGAANDGVYANGFDNTNETGSYTISVDAQGDSYFGFPFVRHDFLSIAVTQPTNRPPTADANGPYVIGEGDDLTLDASASSDPDPGDALTFRWDVNGDGVFDDATGQTPTLTWADLVGLGIDHGPDIRTVTVEVSDGRMTDTDSASLYVSGVGLDNGVLRIVGTEGDDCVKVVRAGHGNLKVRANFASPWRWVFPADAIDQVDALLFGGDDCARVAYDISIPARLDGGAGDDNLAGGAGPDILLGRTGNDQIRGHKGNDALYGGRHHDWMTGGQGDDFLHGGRGADTMFGWTGRDELDGGSGDDYLRGNWGGDTLRGGPGDDTLRGDNGHDLLEGGDGDDLLCGNSGRDILRGGSGQDILGGGWGNDVLLGGEDGDQLFGQAGFDLLIGGLGGDALSGGSGGDALIGGTTDHDSNDAALIAILDEWDRQFTPVDVRIANLRDGTGVNAPFVLKRNLPAEPDGTVFDDGERDELRGNSGQDWFLDFATDLVQDRGPSDR